MIPYQNGIEHLQCIITVEKSKVQPVSASLSSAVNTTGSSRAVTSVVSASTSTPSSISTPVSLNTTGK